MVKNTFPVRNCLSCLVSIMVVCGIPVCLFLGWLVSDDINRFLKSFEFPVIEARARPYNALMATISQDELINEDYRIDHVSVTITHPEKYTGLVGVDVDKVYGTNLPFEDVQKQFAQFFSTHPDWYFDSGYDEYKRVTEYGVACISLEKTSKQKYPEWFSTTATAEYTKYASSWAKYQTVYTIRLNYMEPGRSCHIG